jgi:hypothetical protein
MEIIPGNLIKEYFGTGNNLNKCFAAFLYINLI